MPRLLGEDGLGQLCNSTAKLTDMFYFMKRINENGMG